MKIEDGLVKIYFPLDPSHWHQKTGERMWARPLSGEVFVVENSPLYALGVSYKDVVSAKLGLNDELVFDHVVSRGGHSNYQLWLRDGVTKNEFEKLWNELELLGCSYEGSINPADSYAIDVPPDVDLGAVHAVLLRGDREGIWDFGEGHCGQSVPMGTRN